MKQFRFFSVVFTAAVIFSSCSKEGPAALPVQPEHKEQTGAAGAAGTTGASDTATMLFILHGYLRLYRVWNELVGCH